jgi:hypothetical protein
VDLQRVLSSPFSIFLVVRRATSEGPRAFPWRKKGLIVPFLLGALFSSIDQPQNIGDMGIFVLVISMSLCS